MKLKTHQIRGAAVVSIATFALALLMFLPMFLNFGFAYGFVLLLVIVFGVFDLFGALETIKPGSEAPADKGASVDLAGEPRWLQILAGFNIRIFYVGVALCVAGACRISVIGTMGAHAVWSGPMFFVLGLGAFALARIKRGSFDGNLHQGFFVMSVATAALMATLGSHGLWDCWETHYGEVARRQLEQDDWISLFWQNKWFYSKPILIFWLMNLGMILFGVNVQPDQMSNHAEWGVRFFVAVISLAVLGGVYSLIARRVSKRAGVFSVLVLATMPMFGFMSRQALTDLPFIGFMTLAVVFFLMGITTPKETVVKPVDVPLGGGKKLKLSGFHGVIAGYLLIALPQILYLTTRNDSFVSGTLGRGDLRVSFAKERFTGLNLSDLFDFAPSLERTLGVNPVVPTDLSLDWFLVGMAFLIPFSFIILTLRRERRVHRLCFHAMYICLGLSVMAKGIAGLVMPLLGLFGLWITSTPWKKVFRPKNLLSWHLEKAIRLDLIRGIPMFLFVSAPWYIAMILRHGDAFINRFFIHDHIKRLADGVHGGRGTFQYFLEQFGYAAFPWVGLLPFALFAWPGLLRKGGSSIPKEGYERTIRLFLTCWFVMSFALLSFMTTKFHHYAFPLIPSAAILIGLFLNDIWSKRVNKLGPVVILAVVIIAVIAMDLVADPNVAKGVQEGYAKLLGLFIYKYSRPYPSAKFFDYSIPLFVFSAMFVFSFLGWLIKRRRFQAMVATMLIVLAFSHWATQHYMIQLAPHWTQRHLIDEYYKRRTSPDERLVAFQMNWKGENFYTGNRVIVHVSTKNKNFEKWVEKHRGERHFFVTEYKRYQSMSKRAGAASGPLKPFADTCNKYRAGWADKL